MTGSIYTPWRLGLLAEAGHVSVWRLHFPDVAPYELTDTDFEQALEDLNGIPVEEIGALRLVHREVEDAADWSLATTLVDWYVEVNGWGTIPRLVTA